MRKLKSHYLLIGFALFAAFNAFTQENFTITGNVVDSNGLVVESGNIILLSPLDSAVIRGTYFETAMRTVPEFAIG